MTIRELQHGFDRRLEGIDQEGLLNGIWVEPSVIHHAEQETRFQDAEYLVVLRVTLVPGRDNGAALEVAQRILGSEPVVSAKAFVQRTLMAPSMGHASERLASELVRLMMAHPTPGEPVSAVQSFQLNEGTRRPQGERMIVNLKHSPIRQLALCLGDAKGYLLSWFYKIFSSMLRGTNRDIFALLLSTTTKHRIIEVA